MSENRWVKYFIVFMIALVSISLHAQFTPEGQSEIVKKSTKLLADYEAKINLLGKDIKSIDKTRNHIEKLLELFVDGKVQIFNDLDPSHKLSNYYEAETYATNIALWYPDGIKIILDFENAQVSNILSHGQNLYSIDFKVDKKIEGIYLGKTPNNENEKLIFRVGFLYEKGEYQQFVIAGIHSADEKDYFDENDKVFEIKSIRFPMNTKRDIDRETKTLLNDYANYLSLIGDTVENIEDKMLYKESFRGLFVNTQYMIFNDVLPDNRKNQEVTVSDYINLYSEAYASSGGKVIFNIDSADLGFIFKTNDTIYYRNVMVNKSFEGNYLGKRKIIQKSRIKITIDFMYLNNVYKNFKIRTIDQINSNKAEIIENNTFTDLNKRKSGRVEPLTKEALNPSSKSGKTSAFFSVNFSVGEGKIMNGNLNELTLTKNAHEWKTNPGLSYSFSGQLGLMVKPWLGVYLGIGYSTLSTKYSIDSYEGSDTAFKDPTIYQDINGDSYQKMIKTKYDSLISIDYINIPIGLVMDIKVSRRIHLYFKPGIELGFLNKATSESNGFLNYYGYYENQTIPVLQVIDWPEFGAYSIKANNTKEDIKPLLNSFNLNIGTTLGIGINLNSKTSIVLSGNIQYGLTDLMKSKENYIDVFGQTEINNSQPGFGKSDYNLTQLKSLHEFEHKPTRIFNYGMALEFIVKF